MRTDIFEFLQKKVIKNRVEYQYMRQNFHSDHLESPLEDIEGFFIWFPEESRDD